MIALVILHECIHAFLNEKLLESNTGITISDINNQDFATCINQYFNGFSGSQSQHDFMAYYMIPEFVEILHDIKALLHTTQEIAIAENPTYENGGVILYSPMNTSPPSTSSNPIPWNWNDYYIHLSFVGLENCASYLSFYPPNSFQAYYKTSYQAAGLIMFQYNPE